MHLIDFGNDNDLFLVLYFLRYSRFFYKLKFALSPWDKQISSNIFLVYICPYSSLCFMFHGLLLDKLTQNKKSFFST